MLQRASLLADGSRLVGNHWIFQQYHTAVYNTHLTKDFSTWTTYEVPTSLLETSASIILDQQEQCSFWDTAYSMWDTDEHPI